MGKIIRHIRAKKKGIKKKEGRITEFEQEYKQIWKEYFENLLTDCEIQAPSEYELEQNVEDTTEEVDDPTMAEIEEIINKSRNGKAPGKDGIRMEMFKYGGQEIKEKLYQLIKRIWQQERMPQEWKCGQIIAIHKKGEQRLCNNYRGITLLNTWTDTVHADTEKIGGSNKGHGGAISKWF